MSMQFLRRLLTTTAAVAVLAFPAVAATPEEGDIAGPNDETTWEGGPFLVSNPAACLGSDDPTCDSFRFTVSSNAVKRVLVAIAPAEGYEHDDYDLFVYDDQGVLLGHEASSSGYESVVIDHTGSPWYEVRVQPWGVESGSSYTGVAMRTKEQAFDEPDWLTCVEAVPAKLSLADVLDDGSVIELSVMLLLDGTDAKVAEQVMARAADAYSPLKINLTLVSTRHVNFESDISSQLIADAKEYVGGTPPKGVDIVGVFTSKRMQSTTGGTVVGQADCIGGIRFDETSFFVASDIRHIEDPSTGTTGTLNQMGFNPNVDATAEVVAHEIGHLMGGHHHYANCVEGNLSSTSINDLSPCTLMFNAVNFASINFTGLNNAVVRGHAVEYAAP